MNIPSIVQFDCIIFDLVVAKDNIEIQKKIKKNLQVEYSFQSCMGYKTTLGKVCLRF